MAGGCKMIGVPAGKSKQCVVEQSLNSLIR